MVFYKMFEVYEAGNLVGEIFTEYPASDIHEILCFVGRFKRDSLEIDNSAKKYADTNFGMVFTEDLVDKLDDIFSFWNKRKKKMAGWIERINFHTGKLGYEYSKSNSEEWIFIEDKRIKKDDIKKIPRDEIIEGFSKIEEKYVNDEFAGESFRLPDGTIFELERSEIGFKKDDGGLIIIDYDLPTFNDLINLWKNRRSKYEVQIQKPPE